MTNKRRTDIRIETHEITVIKTNGKPLSAFCERCQKSVAAFAPEQGAMFFRLSLTEEVCRRDETERYTTTWVWRGGRWQIASDHTSTVKK